MAEMHDISDQAKGTLLLAATIIVGAFMCNLDATIVNVSLPSIANDFSMDITQASWAVTIYTLVIAGILLICGKTADTLGFRKVYLTGVMLFTLGSFLCGFLPGATHLFGTLLIGRVVQAMGGAMLVASGPAIFTAFYTEKARANFIGLFMMVVAAGMALGPIVGGFLTQINWTLVFFINVPVGIILLLSALKCVPVQSYLTNSLKGFDTAGSVLIFTGLACLLFCISQIIYLGPEDPLIMITGVLAAILLVLFVFRELKYPMPVLDLKLFKIPNFGVKLAVYVIVVGSLGAIEYLIPYYLQKIHGFAPVDAGILVTGTSAGLIVTGLISGTLYNKFGGKKVCVAGSAIFTTALCFFMLFTDTTPSLQIMATLFLYGLGAGVLMGPLANLILSAVPKDKCGMASGIIGICEFAPATISIAICNLILCVTVISELLAQNIVFDPLPKIPSDVLVVGFETVFFCAMIVGIAAFILTLFIKEKPADEE